MGMPVPIYYTADMVRALPEDGNRYEVVRGELLVTPAPRPGHQTLLGRLYFAIAGYLQSHRVGEPYFSPADISWDDDVLVQPDLFVVALEQARTSDWSAMKELLLAAEVLSPSSLRADRFTKRLEYQRQGVGLYWIVDPKAQQVEVWTPADHLPRIERERLVWEPAGASVPFSLELAELFRPI